MNILAQRLMKREKEMLEKPNRRQFLRRGMLGAWLFGAGGVAGLCAAWLQFFRWDHAEHQGEGLPHFQRLPAMDGQHFRPAGLAGWTG